MSGATTVGLVATSTGPETFGLSSEPWRRSAAQEELGNRIDRRTGGALRENGRWKERYGLAQLDHGACGIRSRARQRSRARRTACDASATHAPLQESGPDAVKARSARGGCQRSHHELHRAAARGFKRAGNNAGSTRCTGRRRGGLVSPPWFQRLQFGAKRLLDDVGIVGRQGVLGRQLPLCPRRSLVGGCHGRQFDQQLLPEDSGGIWLEQQLRGGWMPATARTICVTSSNMDSRLGSAVGHRWIGGFRILGCAKVGCIEIVLAGDPDQREQGIAAGVGHPNSSDHG